MPAKPVLSEADKIEIKRKLLDLCEHYWTSCGYKKTSIKELCSGVEISIGTFYTLYPTKEDLFLETILNIQAKLKRNALDIIEGNPSREGFAHSIKEMLREYDSKPILYQFNTPDFQSFVTKLPDEAMALIKLDNIDFFREAIKAANLKLKMDELTALGVFSALLATIGVKETLSATCDFFSVFDFMVDTVTPAVFEKNDSREERK